MTWQPNDGTFHATLEAGFACYRAERFEEAARILGDILPTIVSPQVPEAWWLYGDALAHIGRLEEAAAALTSMSLQFCGSREGFVALRKRTYLDVLSCDSCG